MSRKHFFVLGTFLLIFALVSVLLASCSVSGSAQGTTGGNTTTTTTPAATATSSGSGQNCANGTVHTLATTFQETCVNVAKGSFLKVVPSAQSLHILANGSWVNNQPHPSTESGAPTLQNVQVANQPVQIGPFTTAGTFHIYCTIHPGMQLTVYVK